MPVAGEHCHRHAVVNGVRLHYVEAGDGPLVLLLHGFPEFWYSWRHQIAALAGAGFRVIAPDLRGYNDSDKPSGIRSYRIDALTADVTGLIAHAGYAQAHLVGHDWGGVIAWYTAMQHPAAVDKLAILNAPHPAAFVRELRSIGQMLRSSYVLFFQLSVLPERLLRAGDFFLLRRMLRRQPTNPNAFAPGDVDQYKRAWSQPGAIAAALNYYRAALRYRRAARDLIRPVTAPTLLLWGEPDPYLGPRLTRDLETWIPRLHIERIPLASHWLQNDAPERVNQALLAFLTCLT